MYICYDNQNLFNKTNINRILYLLFTVYSECLNRKYSYKMKNKFKKNNFHISHIRMYFQFLDGLFRFIKDPVFIEK